MKKKHALILTLSAALYLTSCEKTAEHPTPSIIGKWNVTKIHLIQVSNGKTRDTTISRSNEFIQFKNLTDAVLSVEGITSGSGSTMTPDYIGIYAYTYRMTGKTLTLTSAAGTVRAIPVIQFDERTLVLHTEETDGSTRSSIDTYYTKD